MRNMRAMKPLRLAADLSQRQLASAVGVTQGAVAQWEAGVCLPSAPKLPILARVLGCSIDALYGDGRTDVAGRGEE